MLKLVLSRVVHLLAISAFVMGMVGVLFTGSASGQAQQVSFAMDEVDGSGVHGIARVEASGVDQVYVLLVMSNAVGGETAAVHAGACDALAEVAFSLHNIDGGGYSGTFTDGITFHQLIQTPHAVAVYGVGADSSRVVSCGEIDDGALPPFVLTVSVERVAVLNSASGVVIVQGTVSCSAPGIIDVLVGLEQRVRRDIVSGAGGSGSVACEGLSATSWSAEVSGWNGTFITRPATAFVSVAGCGRDLFLCDEVETPVTVRLVAGS